MTRLIAFVATLAAVAQPGVVLADYRTPTINKSGGTIACHSLVGSQSSCTLTYPQNDDANPGDGIDSRGDGIGADIADGASRDILPPSGVPMFQINIDVQPIQGEVLRSADLHFFGTFALTISTRQQLSGGSYLMYLMDWDESPGGLNTWTPVAYATNVTPNGMTLSAPAPVLRVNHAFVFQVVSCTFESLHPVPAIKPCPPLRAPKAPPLRSTSLK